MVDFFLFVLEECQAALYFAGWVVLGIAPCSSVVQTDRPIVHTYIPLVSPAIERTSGQPGMCRHSISLATVPAQQCFGPDPPREQTGPARQPAGESAHVQQDDKAPLSLPVCQQGACNGMRSGGPRKNGRYPSRLTLFYTAAVLVLHGAKRACTLLPHLSSQVCKDILPGSCPPPWHFSSATQSL
ncbi:hypothetical protein P4O66_011523 [Electrophorus voltai]|uniref:Uncharacterized protein n=1 Tax=Electrophorus voltai TaxID=2609070 RepID=A0AAD8Z868_9TELE|nr:hypothetical protein P4O66_011523 [Electrophorus voltai]